MDTRTDRGEFYPGGESRDYPDGGGVWVPMRLRPSAPTALKRGDCYLSGGSLYVYDGSAWIVVGGGIVDPTLDPTSSNAVANSAVCGGLDAKLSTSGGTMTGGIVLEERETTADMGGLLINGGAMIGGGTVLRLVKWENGTMSSVTLTAENVAVKSDIAALAQTVAGKLDVETSAYYFYVSADGHLAVRDAQTNAIYLFGGDGSVADGVARGEDLPYATGVAMDESEGVYFPIDRAVNSYEAADGDTTLTLNMPQPMAVDQGGRARDFVLDVDNSANTGALGVEFELLGEDYALAVTDGDDLAEITELAAGERARFYFTETTQTFTPTGAQAPIPVISIQRMTIEVVTTQGGA